MKILDFSFLQFLQGFFLTLCEETLQTYEPFGWNRKRFKPAAPQIVNSSQVNLISARLTSQ